MKYKYPILILTLLCGLTGFARLGQAQSGIGTLDPWKVTGKDVTTRNTTLGLKVAGLATSTTGCLAVDSLGWITPSGSACGVGVGGSSSSFSTTSADYWGLKGLWTAGAFNATSTATSTLLKLSATGVDAGPFVKATLGQFGLIQSTTTNATSTFLGGLSAAGLLSSNGLTITAGGFTVPNGVVTNAALANSTLTAGNGTCTTGSGSTALGGTFTVAVTSNCTDATTLDSIDSTGFLRANASSNLLTGNTLTINSGGTLSVAGTFSITSTATSTSAGGFLSQGLDTKFLTAQQILLGTGSATTTVLSGTGTSTFAGGVSAANLDATSGLTSSGVTLLGGTFKVSSTGQLTSTAASQSNFTAAVNTSATYLVKNYTTLGHDSNDTTLQISNTSSLIDVGFFTNSLQAMTFKKNTGFLGIGTTTPAALLSLTASTTCSVTLCNPLFIISTSTATATSTALLVDSNGKLGIGTTSPYAQLTVAGVVGADKITVGQGYGSSTFAGGVATAGLASSNGLTITAGALNLNSESFTDLTGTGLVNTGGVLTTSCIAITGSADLCDGNDSGGAGSNPGGASGNVQFNLSNAFAGDDAFNWDSTTKRLGVGTTTPQWNFQVASTAPSIALTDTAANANLKHWLITSQRGSLRFGTSSDAYATSTPSALTISNSGNVGIGKDSPIRALDIVRNDSTTYTDVGSPQSSLYFGNNNPTDNNFSQIQFRTSDTLGNEGTGVSLNAIYTSHLFSGSPMVSADFAISTKNLGTQAEALRITGTGNVGLGTTSPGTLLSIGNTGGINFVPTATSTFGSSANGINIANGCFAKNGVCISGTGAGLDLTATNAWTSTGTTTWKGGHFTTAGYDGKFVTTQQILIGTGSATTTSLVGTGTSTFAGGVSAAGLASSNGLTISSGGFTVPNSVVTNAALANSTMTAGNGTCSTGSGSTALGATFTINVTSNCTDSTTLDSIDSTGFLRANASSNLLTGNTLTINSGGTLTVAGTFGVTGTATSTFNGGLLADGFSGRFMQAGNGQFGALLSTSTIAIATTSSARLGIANASLATTPLLLLSTSTANSTSTAFIVDSNGKIGIGTSSPSGLLEVVGQTIIKSIAKMKAFAVKTDDGSDVFSVDTSGTTAVGIGTSTPAAYLSIAPATTFVPLLISTSTASATSTALIVDFQGRLGIGTTSPTQTLSVQGDALISNRFWAPKITSANTGDYVCFNTVGGEITQSATACSLSSLRWKENIREIDGGLDKILKLHPIIYDLKPEYGTAKGRPGFIAEEVELVLPRMVSYGEDGKPTGLDYPQYTAYITKAIQDFYGQFQKLISRVSGLEKKLTEQQKEIDILNARLDKLENK